MENSKMTRERWAQAVMASSNDRNYRREHRFTETRDDYFVDGVQWADENPRKGLVDLDNVWHSITEKPYYIENDTTHNSIVVIGKTSVGIGMSVGTMIDKDKIYVPLTQKEYVWGECPFTKWAYITDLIPESLNNQE
jgi:hypothetical protein